MAPKKLYRGSLSQENGMYARGCTTSAKVPWAATRVKAKRDGMQSDDMLALDASRVEVEWALSRVLLPTFLRLDRGAVDRSKLQAHSEKVLEFS